MGKKYIILARNYSDKFWNLERQTNFVFLATIFMWWMCFKYNVVEMRKSS